MNETTRLSHGEDRREPHGEAAQARAGSPRQIDAAPVQPVNLTLYNIETELLELLAFREDVANDPEATPADIAESLKAIDAEVEDYLRKEVAKADNVASYLRECETRVLTLKAEAARVMLRAKAWEARGERLEAVVTSIMQATGKTKIEGAKSTLRLAKNPPSVDVRQPDLVPPDFQRVSVKMHKSSWDKIREDLEEMGVVCEVTALDPLKTAIKAELKAGRAVPGCVLIEDAVRLEVK